MECSVIISTSNRSSSLKKTLRAFGEVVVPPGWSAELVLIDNGSKDETKAVVETFYLPNFTIRYLFEPKLGKSNALNSGIAVAQGDVLLFTDDDVAPDKNWLTKLATPLLRREWDGAVGRVELAKHLLRPWMDSSHRHRLAAPDITSSEVIGANMGFHRSVFERIPTFDPELGPGASGLGEETLFALQFLEAGFRLTVIPEASVVHDPEPSRLLRREWLSGSQKHGRTKAYLTHHWEHRDLKMPRLCFCYYQVKLHLRRFIQPPPNLDQEGCPPWEMSYVTCIEKYSFFLKERRKPRKYAKHGLEKIDTPATTTIY